MGKGRQIAAVILDNMARGRTKAIWMSISTDLHVDAPRDLQDVGCHCTVIEGCKGLDAGQSKGLGIEYESIMPLARDLSQSLIDSDCDLFDQAHLLTSSQECCL